MTERKGPFVTFPHGQYKGLTIEELMRKDPHYFLVAVKRWMDVSPSQANYFTVIFDGAEIPEQFIKPFPDLSVKSFEQILEEERYDFDNECWEKRENNYVISKKKIK